MLNLNANDKLENQPMFIRKISKKVGQNNKEYYHLEISYGVKNYEAKIWHNNLSIAEDIESGCIAYISGTVKDFKGTLQIHIDNMIKITEPGKELLDELLPTSSLEPLKLSDELNSIIETINTLQLRVLLKNIFSTPAVKESFFSKAAGVEIHHAYVGGLAEHTIEVAKIVINLCSIFNYINYDVAVASALLHDIGKTIELSDFPECKYTNRGRLLGHIAIGVNIIDEEISKLKDFPEEMKLEIEHCILSHHGSHEAGSPVLPMTLEAITLANADRVSAELNGFHLAIERDCGTDSWTDYNNIYKRYIKKS